jgi:cell division protein FtsW|tara:strand:- start:253 stop:1356 length:1104 start_codon:yes stop_codon:yes gene_type:complete
MIDRENIFIIFPYFCLLFIGLIMVASSSIYVSEDIYGTPFHFASRQVIFFIIGILLTIIALSIPSNLLLTLDWIILLGSFVLLIALFIPGVGTEVNGSLRWIRIGPINVQPSEVSKLALVIYISGYCVRRLSEINTSLGFFRPLFVLAVFGLLILSQPDLGSTLVIGSLVIAILFFAGISFLQFTLLLSLMGSLAAIAIYLEPYRYLRFISFTEPFEHFYGPGWQLSNALLGIGRGEWFGIGLGNSLQKNLYLPEPHTDFIFAVIVEEFGLIGGLVIILLFAVLIFGIIKTSIKALELGKLFQGFLVFGAGILIAIQVVFNIGVNLGILPTKGLTLPFISYGGTSLILFMFLMGIVLRINFENKHIK